MYGGIFYINTALNDAKKISPEMLTLFDPDKPIAANKSFIREFIQRVVPQSERGDFFQKTGEISKAGINRIENALIAKAYNDSTILNRLNEVYDDDIKNITNALLAAAPKIAVLENGGFRDNLSIRDDIVQAVNALIEIKDGKGSVADYLSQIRIFNDEISPAAKKLLQFFDKNKRSSKKIAQGLINYAESAMKENKQNQPTLPGMEDSSRSKSMILREALNNAENEQSKSKSQSERYNQSDNQDRDEHISQLRQKLRDIKPSQINLHNLSDKSFISDRLVERYNQDMLHGTGHILLGNKFDLSKIGTGERGASFGWGIYLAQARGVAQTYRLFGLEKNVAERQFNVFANSITFLNGNGQTIKFSDLEKDSLDYKAYKIIIGNLFDTIYNDGEDVEHENFYYHFQRPFSKEYYNFAHDKNLSAEERQIYQKAYDILNNLNTVENIPQDLEDAELKIYLNDGTVISYDNYDKSTSAIEQIWFALSNLHNDYNFVKSFRRSNNPLETLKDGLKTALETKIKDQKYWINKAKHEPSKENTFMSKGAKDDIATYKQSLALLNNIQNIDFVDRGNIYEVDGPENNVLLDWDAKLSQQPVHVKHAINKLLKSLAKYENTHDLSAIKNAKTGQEFYWALTNLMHQINPNERADKQASLLINKFGVPGLRFWDRQSRFNPDKSNGTHNFVVWNTDTLRVMGISLDSDEDAQDYFSKTQIDKINSEYAESYNQPSIDTGNINDDLNISQAQINAVRRQYQGTDKWLKAPNGKKTNLSEKQWLQVRTENFKRWFGDWENNPSQASKILDENGEPLVVYHGSLDGDFSVFNTKGRGRTKGTGSWFTSSRQNVENNSTNIVDVKELAKSSLHYAKAAIESLKRDGYTSVAKINDGYRDGRFGKDEAKHIAERFKASRKLVDLQSEILHIINSLDDTNIDADNDRNISLPQDYSGFSSERINEAKSILEGLIDREINSRKNYRIYDTFLNIRNPYIYNAHGNNWDNLDGSSNNYSTDKLAHDVWNGKFNSDNSQDTPYDGIIIRDVIDGAKIDNSKIAADDFIIPNSGQVKSASRNNGNFSTTDSDIYHQSSTDDGHPYYDADDETKRKMLQKIRRTNDAFVSPDMVERYNQDWWHGTGHIIEGGKFDLRKIGSGEGEAAFGWGIYLAEERLVAESYRTMGLSAEDLFSLFDFKLHMNDGEVISNSERSNPIIKEIFGVLKAMATHAPNLLGENTSFSDTKRVLKEKVTHQIGFMLSYYENLLVIQKRNLPRYAKYVPEEYLKDGIRDTEKRIKLIHKNIARANAILDKIQKIDVSDNAKRGNIYKVDGPEKDILLDWDADLSKQPKRVSRALKKVIAKVQKFGGDISTLQNAQTGQEFYEALEREMYEILQKKRLQKKGLRSKTYGYVTRSDMAASLMLHQEGIPGLIYWDQFSREEQSGTRNAVIWNTDLLKILGVTEDSDKDAKEYFKYINRYTKTEQERQSQSSQSESYNQIIYESGARRLDESEGTNIRMDNLRIARQMELNRKSDKSIWLATGWQRGIDGDWRYEIMDGEFIDTNSPEFKAEREELEALNKKLYGTDEKPTILTQGEIDKMLGEISTPKNSRTDSLTQEEIDELLSETPEADEDYESDNDEEDDEPTFASDRLARLGFDENGNFVVTPGYSDDNETETAAPRLTDEENSRRDYLNEKLNSSKLQYLFDAPELYRAYPELKNIEVDSDYAEDYWDESKGVFIVRFDENNNFDPEGSTISLHSELNDNQKRDVLIYGIQYIIQQIENASNTNKTGSPAVFAVIDKKNEIATQKFLDAAADIVEHNPDAGRFLEKINERAKKNPSLTIQETLDIAKSELKIDDFLAYFDVISEAGKRFKTRKSNKKKLSTQLTKLLKRSANLQNSSIYRNAKPALQRKFDALLKAKNSLSVKDFHNLVQNTLNKSERKSFIKLINSSEVSQNISKLSPDKIKTLFIDFGLLANQAEARNAQRRSTWDAERRRTTPLGESENISRTYNDTPIHVNSKKDYDFSEVKLKKGKSKGDSLRKEKVNSSDLLDDLFRDIDDNDNFSESYNQSSQRDNSDERQVKINFPEEQIEAVRAKYQGTRQWLRAPNGRRSNLNERQWLQVRTPNFINWFGDWENDPEHASKVLDENGEPLVVYRGTKGDEPSGDGQKHRTFHATGTGKTENTGSWFTSKPAVAETYSIYKNQAVYPVFLNIRNPYVIDMEGKAWNDFGNFSIRDNVHDTVIQHDAEGKPFSSWDEAEDYIKNVLGGNLSINITTTPDGKWLPHSDYEILHDTTDSLTRNIRSDGNHDGVIFKNILDVGIINFDSDPELDSEIAKLGNAYENLVRGDKEWYEVPFDFDQQTSEKIAEIDQRTNELDKLKEERKKQRLLDYTADDFVIFKSTQVKSAIDNTGEFNPDNPDIYHQIAGTTAARNLDEAEGVYFRMDNLKLARKMRARGNSPKYIKFLTGWEFGHDGEWKFEIQDGRITVDISKIRKSLDAKNSVVQLDLSDIYHNPELFKAYPELKNLPVRFKKSLPQNARGLYHQDKADTKDAGEKYIEIKSEMPINLIRSTLIHEIQHAVQHIEGFSIGGNQSLKNSDALEIGKKLIRAKLNHSIPAIRKIAKLYMQGKFSEADKLARKLSSKDAYVWRSIKDDIEDFYSQNINLSKGYNFLASEVEARNVQTRMNMTEDERTNSLLSDTEDTDREYQITRKINPDGSESYNQIIGETGTIRLDFVEGTDTRTQNLKLAKQMERQRLSSKKIWAATGWQRGADGKWRYEIPDGKIKGAALRKIYRLEKEFGTLFDIVSSNNSDANPDRVLTEQQAKRFHELQDILYNAKIGDIFDAPELFKAYPQLRNIRFGFEEDVSWGAMYEPNLNMLLVNMEDYVEISPSERKKYIIHELQHAVQDIEGFAAGTSPDGFTPDADGKINPNPFVRKNFARKANMIYDTLSSEQKQKFDSLRQSEKSLSKQEFNKLLRETLSKDERKIYLDWRNAQRDSKFARTASKISPEDAYMLTAGEVEARNAETRANWGDRRRRNTPLDWSEDFERDIQLVIDGYGTAYSQDNDFITPDILERYNQDSLHGTGHIIEGNQPDLSYSGSGQGAKSFGYGFYSAQARDVAEDYRKYGLPDDGRGTLTLSFNDGKKFSVSNDKDFENIHDESGLVRQLLIDMLYAKKYHPDKYKTPGALIQDTKSTYELMLSEAKRHLKRAQKTDRFGFEVSLAKKNIESHMRMLELINNIKSLELTGFKNGNIYKIDVPEDHELLDWDAKLSEQPDNIKSAIREAVDMINNNPAKGVAMAFAHRLKKSKSALANLERIVHSLEDKFKGHYINFYERQSMPEYQTVKNLFYAKDKNAVDEFFDAVNKIILTREQSFKFDEDNATGEKLYWALADLLGSDVHASMYLNSLGIPGHRYWDGLSRVKGKGTHNFVIWNMKKLKVLGLTEDSDEDAKDYFARTKAKLEQADPENITPENLGENNNLASDSLVEKYNQDMLHGTGHILLGNKFDLSKMGSGEGAQAFGWGAYLAQAMGVAQSYRKMGIPTKDTISITDSDGKSFGYLIDSENDYIYEDAKTNRDNIIIALADDARRILQKNNNLSLDEVKSMLRKQYEDEIQKTQSKLERLEENKKYYSGRDGGRVISINLDIDQNKKRIPQLREQIKALDKISNFKFEKAKKGNIYKFDGPEDDVLLDWDESLDNQPEHVLKAIQKIKTFARRLAKLSDLDYSAVEKSDTGEDLYKSLARFFAAYNHENFNWHTDKKNKKAASLLFNKFGVPGLRFWDGGSRDKQSGTHNFVIWDADALNLMGLTDDSDEDAKEYFRDMQAKLDKANSAKVNISDDSDLAPDKLIENYNQLAYHGTGHILLGNVFDFNKINSGEGSQHFGWGAYFAKKLAVAQNYRRYGLNNRLWDSDFKITTRDGKTFTVNETFDWLQNFKGDKKLKSALAAIPGFVYQLSESNPDLSTQDIIRELKNSYESSFSDIISSIQDNIDNASDNYEIREQKQQLERVQKEYKQTLDFIDSISDIEIPHKVSRQGNIYKFDIPENKILLDYDKSLDSQSPHVRKAIGKIREAIINMGINPARLDNAQTGQEFYDTLEDTLAEYVRKNNIHDGISRSDKRASLFLNKFGIPGLRYLDGESRSRGKGSYNFTIWDAETLKLLGLTDDSSREAKNYFAKTKAEEEKKIKQAQDLSQKLGAFGDDTAERYAQHFNRTYARDTDSEVQKLLERNRQAEPAFRNLMNELQKQTGGRLITRTQMKSPERIIAKANRLFGGDVSRVPDVWAGTLVFDTEEDLFDALKIIKRRRDLNRLDNRWNRPKRSSGYRDVISNFRLDDGTLVELQLQIEDMQEVKDSIGHSIYEFTRSNKHNDELYDTVWDAGEVSKVLYDSAINGSYRKLSQKQKETLHKLGEDLARSSGVEQAQKALTALQDFIDENLSPDNASNASSRVQGTHDSVKYDAVSSSTSINDASGANKYTRPGGSMSSGISSSPSRYSTANGAPSRMKYSNNDDSSSHDNNNRKLSRKNHAVNDPQKSFMTQEKINDFIDRYNQERTHATGHIILGNRFDLRRAGSGEGGSVFGHGIYLEESLDVAEHYRKYGLKPTPADEKKLAQATITINNRKRFAIDQDGKILNSNLDENSTMGLILSDIRNIVNLSINTKLFSTKEIKQRLSTQTLKMILRNQYLDEIENFSSNEDDDDTPDYIKERIPVMLKEAQEKLEALKDIENIDLFSYFDEKRGNIYRVDIPEDYDLLDWDAPISKQPENVKKLIKNLAAELKAKGFSESEILGIPEHINLYSIDTQNMDASDITGGALYQNIVNIMYQTAQAHLSDFDFIDYSINNPNRRAKAAASYLFNLHGIPGHRYWDRMSRTDNNGTHNYVIWNEDKLKILGLTEDSDDDAKEYFARTKAEQEQSGSDNTERYNQIIGEYGARILDEQEDNSTRLDNLEIALQMTQDGKDPKTIWLATGWEKGRDGKWKYEIPDGKIITKSLNGSKKTFKLSEIFDAPELFKAYSELYIQNAGKGLSSMLVHFDDLNGEKSGFFDIKSSSLYIEQSLKDNPQQLRLTLIHEIQHAIQEIEGFAKGGSEKTGDEIRTKADTWATYEELKNYSKENPDIDNPEKLMELLLDDHEKMGWPRLNQSVINNALSLFKTDGRFIDDPVRQSGKGYEDAYNIWSKLGYGYDPNDIDTYRNLAGEVEARNVQKRNSMSDDERRNTPLAETEDRARKGQIVIQRDEKGIETYSQNSLDTPEEQLQAVRAKYEGTTQWLKAPNGKKSNLTERQWLQVRTENFKKWFGDWENDPQNASKVLDENGEPLVVYHGTPNGGFSVFNMTGEGYSTNTGAWFTSSRDNAKSYASYGDKNLYGLFLNIRNPFVIEANGRNWNELGDIWIEDTETGEIYYKDDKGKPFTTIDDTENYVFRKIDEGAFEADTEERSYREDPDTGRGLIYGRYYVGMDTEFSHTNDIVRGVFNGELTAEDVDGVIFKNIYDNARNSRIMSDVFVTRTKENIKSATNNTGEFNPDNPDIYHQSSQQQDNDEIRFTNSDGRQLRINFPEEQMLAVRNKYRRTKQWLKAPNGKKSNLDERQWIQVRTPNFKRWFGDWEGNPEKASKVLDENGEPRIVYHGAKRGGGFSVFNTMGFGDTKGTGAWFAADPNVAKGYIRGSVSQNFYATFLNIRNPFVFEAKGRNWDQLGDVYIYDFKTKKDILTKKNGQPFESMDDAYDYISSTLGNQLRGNLPRYEPWMDHELDTTEKITRAVWDGDLDNDTTHDGVIFSDILDGSDAYGIRTPTDVFVVPQPVQIKSATRNNGEFGVNNEEIYSQSSQRNTRDYEKYHVTITNANGTQTTFRLPIEQFAHIYGKYYRTDQWLKAPNGKKSNLNDVQWVQVRTPAFKKWFGDWENDPDNASKILDANGEPLIVYHGTVNGGFSVFDTNGRGQRWGTGAWFTSQKVLANEFAVLPETLAEAMEINYEDNKDYVDEQIQKLKASGQVNTQQVYSTFLNIRAPFIFNANQQNWDSIRVFIIRDNKGLPILIDGKKGKRGRFFALKSDAREYIHSNLKNAQNSQYTITSRFMSTDDIVRAVWKGDFGYPISSENTEYDGVIIENVKESSFYDSNRVVNDYIIRHPIQVKSATNNNGNFGVNNEEIYSQSNPIISRHHFDNPETEQAYSEAKKGTRPESTMLKIKHSIREFMHGLRGDFPDLATREAKAAGLTFARETLRKMNRNLGAKTQEALDSIAESLKGLTPEQFDIFGRVILLNDLFNFKKFNPKAKLPLGFTPESLRAEGKKFKALAERDARIVKAIKSENSAHEAIKKELAELAYKM